jgi:hypothetical protein
VLIRIASILASWYAMMIVHELGHVLAAWATGSTIAGVFVPWVGFSQTEIIEYRRPIVVVSAGAIVGVALPLAAWLAARTASLAPGWASLSRFFAGFCLVANGGYLGSALVSPVGDAEDLIALGSPTWAVGVPGLLMLAGGLWAWNGLGAKFSEAASPRLTWATLCFAGGTLAAMLLLMFARP